MKLVTTSWAVLVAFSWMGSASTVAQIKSDISSLDSAVASLNQQMQADSLNYLSGLAIHNAAMGVDDKLKSGTADVQSLTETPTWADAQEIINMLTHTEPNVRAATERFIALKPQWESLGVTGAAKGDINSLQTNTKAFSSALVNAAPKDNKRAAQILASRFNSVLAKAAAAYN